MTKIINIIGQPSAGKSTTAAGLFNKMKLAGLNVELTTEWIKSAVWEERNTVFEDQLYITAKQNRQLHRLIGKVDWAISDSPLFLGGIYAPKDYHPSYDKFLMEVFNSYENINYYLNRVKPYNPIGRNQNEQESDLIGKKILKYMKDQNIKYKELDGDEQAAQLIFEDLFKEIDEKCRICGRSLSLENDIYIKDGICNFCQIS